MGVTYRSFSSREERKDHTTNVSTVKEEELSHEGQEKTVKTG